jgi:hypothetical protein
MDVPIVSGHVLDALRDPVLSLPAVDGVLSNALNKPDRNAGIAPNRTSLIHVRIGSRHP